MLFLLTIVLVPVGILSLVSLLLLMVRMRQEDRKTHSLPKTVRMRTCYPQDVSDEVPPALLESRDGSLDLTVVVPAYNEEERLGVMLEEAVAHLEGGVGAQDGDNYQPPCRYEILVVDDGSKDGTQEVVVEFARKHRNPHIKIVPVHPNQGKGNAVRMGMLAGSGQWLLMADADGATKFAELVQLKRLASELIDRDGLCVVVGSRAHLESEAVAKRSLVRNILMWGFHMAVRLLGGVRGIHDTQCGFKLFSRMSARLLFPSQHIKRWCFDVELLKNAQDLGMPIKETPVYWNEIPGSKLGVVSASLSMLKDLLRIRFAYASRMWKVKALES